LFVGEQLDNTHSGQQTLGAERFIELELDRNTEFVDPKAATLQTKAPVDHQPESLGQVVQRRDPLDDLMKTLIRAYPIIWAHGTPNGQQLPYACAPTTNMYFEYHDSHRKALEVIALGITCFEKQTRGTY